MKSIREWNDLREYGINCLTGEACAVGKRLLCDVNSQGHQLLCRILGLPTNTKFAANWNSQVNGEPAIGSIFLYRNLLHFLAGMILLETGCRLALVLDDGLILGIEANDDLTADCEVDDEQEIPDPDKGPGKTKWVPCKKMVKDHPLGQILLCHKIIERYEPLQGQPRSGLSATHAMTGRSQGDDNPPVPQASAN